MKEELIRQIRKELREIRREFKEISREIKKIPVLQEKVHEIKTNDLVHVESTLKSLDKRVWGFCPDTGIECPGY